MKQEEKMNRIEEVLNKAIEQDPTIKFLFYNEQTDVQDNIKLHIVYNLIRRICQLFPQPLEKCLKCDGSGRVYICIGQMNEFYEKCPDCKGSGKTPQPLDKELREKALLTEDDEETKSAVNLLVEEGHSSHTTVAFLRGAKAQQDKDLALLQPKIEEAKQEANRWRELLDAVMCEEMSEGLTGETEERAIKALTVGEK